MVMWVVVGVGVLCGAILSWWVTGEVGGCWCGCVVWCNFDLVG